MAAVAVPQGKQTFIDPATGSPLEFGTVEHFIPSTSVPKLTWSDEAQTAANPDIIVLDAGGQCIIWGTGLYRQRVKDQFGVQIWDQVTGFVSTGGGGGGGDVSGPGASVPGNFVFWASTDGTQISDGGTLVDITRGGTGANTAGGARTALGLGSLATQNTITASQVTDFTEASQDATAALLVAGANITLTYNDPANTLTITATGGGGGGGVTGPFSSVNNEMVLFNGTTGQIITNSGCVPTATAFTFLSAATTTLMRAAIAAEPAGQVLGINTQTASYTLVLGDAGNIVEMNVGSANNLTVPPNSSVAFPIKTRLDLVQLGAGQTTVVQGAGVTVRAVPGLKIAAQYTGGSLYKRGTDEWVLIGNLSA